MTSHVIRLSISMGARVKDTFWISLLSITTCRSCFGCSLIGIKCVKAVKVMNGRTVSHESTNASSSGFVRGSVFTEAVVGFCSRSFSIYFTVLRDHLLFVTTSPSRCCMSWDSYAIYGSISPHITIVNNSSSYRGRGYAFISFPTCLVIYSSEILISYDTDSPLGRTFDLLDVLEQKSTVS